MRFEYIDFAEGTGKVSKQIETYNFHKVSATLAEYGFDCIRLSDDWAGADFLAYHKASRSTLQVQLKSSLVIDKKFLPYEDLYICFPLDKTGGNWYLLKHRTLEQIARVHNPYWFTTPRWTNDGLIWSYRGTREVRAALEPYSYNSRYGSLGYREVRSGINKELK